MNDHLVHTTPNHHPPKIDVLPKTFFQIILFTKSVVQHSGMSPDQQRRPLPFLMSDSYSMSEPRPPTSSSWSTPWSAIGRSQEALQHQLPSGTHHLLSFQPLCSRVVRFFKIKNENRLLWSGLVRLAQKLFLLVSFI